VNRLTDETDRHTDRQIRKDQTDGPELFLIKLFLIKAFINNFLITLQNMSKCALVTLKWVSMSHIPHTTSGS